MQDGQGFHWSPDGQRLAGVVVSRAGLTLWILDGETCRPIATADLEPCMARLPRLVASGVDPDVPIFGGQGARTLHWQWLACSARLVLWAQETTFGTQSTCGAAVFSLTTTCQTVKGVQGTSGLQGGQVMDWGEPLQEPLWGRGAGTFAALSLSNEAILHIPEQKGTTVCSHPQGLSEHKASAQGISTRVELGCRGDSYRFRGPPAIAYAWSPNTCFLAVAGCDGFRDERHALMLHLVDGRSGAVRAECVVTRQQRLNQFIRRVHCQWSPAGGAVCVSLALSRHAMGFGESHVTKFVLRFKT